MPFRLTLVLLFAFALPAEAAVYKCRQADGTTVYQGTPCPEVVAEPLKLPTSGKLWRRCGKDRISLDTSEVPVLAALQAVADFAGKPLVADPQIRGVGQFRYPCNAWRDVLSDIGRKHFLYAREEAGELVISLRPAPGGRTDKPAR